jgi:hypothetical protein
VHGGIVRPPRRSLMEGKNEKASGNRGFAKNR